MATKQDALGRIQWDSLPGFGAWFKENAPGLTNDELQRALRTTHELDVSHGTVAALRQKYNTPMTPATRERAYDSRCNSGESKDPKDQLTPQQKYELSMAQAEMRRISARQTFYEVVGDRIVQAVREMDKKIPPVVPPKKVVPKGLTEEDAVLVISDVQAGLTTSAKETGGLGEFNTPILLKQVEALGNAVESIMKYHVNIKNLHIWFNGDIIEGEDIFPGQLREIDMNIVEQISFCVEHFARLIYRLSHLFESVSCTGTVGNHGRIGRKGEHSPMANFDYLTYKWLAERTKSIPHVSWTIPETWWLINEVQGWRFLQVHGDDTGQSTWGIPFYGAGRHAQRYQEMLRLAQQKGFDYIVLGHHSEPAQFKNVIMAGSWPGGTEFSIKRLQLLDVPSTPLFGVTRQFGKTWRRDIQLRAIPGR